MAAEVCLGGAEGALDCVVALCLLRLHPGGLSLEPPNAGGHRGEDGLAVGPSNQGYVSLHVRSCHRDRDKFRPARVHVHTNENCRKKRTVTTAFLDGRAGF
jgi:hypothetical protein